MGVRFNNRVIIGAFIATTFSLVAAAAMTGDPKEVEAGAAPATSIETTSTTATTSTTLAAVKTTAATVALKPAVRMPSISPVGKINSLVYSYGNAAPAAQAFRAVATARHWTPASIRLWEPFVLGVARRESGFCYNVRRGVVLANPTGCVIKRQGTHSDSGFGQLISIHYKPGAWLCTQEHLCSAEAIISTPWNSMTALVALVERSGRQPWCYTASLRAKSLCRSAPRGLPQR